jgi:hypothetical protein
MTPSAFRREILGPLPHRENLIVLASLTVMGSVLAFLLSSFPLSVQSGSDPSVVVDPMYVRAVGVSVGVLLLTISAILVAMGIKRGRRARRGLAEAQARAPKPDARNQESTGKADRILDAKDATRVPRAS